MMGASLTPRDVRVADVRIGADGSRFATLPVGGTNLELGRARCSPIFGESDGSLVDSSVNPNDLEILWLVKNG